MTQYEDYHRTVVGYHGTGLTAALRIVTRVDGFRWSERDYDWLGRGIYFWEYGPKQALKFAKIRQRQYEEKKDKTPEDLRRATEPLAVVACMIRLGFCLDLTEPEHVEHLGRIFDSYKESMAQAGAPLPKNSRKYRRLDRAVFEYAYKVLKESEPSSTVDTARGIYVSTDGDHRVWPGSWISRDTHIQLCVRNPASLLGTWLHYPTSLEVNDVREALQVGGIDINRENPQGDDQVQTDVEAEED